MTEREYVEAIREAAEAFSKANVDESGFAAAYDDWHRTRSTLPSDTVLSLCEAWLTMQEAKE